MAFSILPSVNLDRRRYAPAPALAGLVDTYWSIEIREPSTRATTRTCP